MAAKSQIPCWSITLSCFVFREKHVFVSNTEIQVMQKFKMGAKSGRENDFCEKSPVESADIMRIRNFIEIALSRSVSEINGFLRYMQNFRMAAKSGGKTIFVKSRQYTLEISCWSKISLKTLYLAPFSR